MSKVVDFHTNLPHLLKKAQSFICHHEWPNSALSHYHHSRSNVAIFIHIASHYQGRSSVDDNGARRQKSAYSHALSIAQIVQILSPQHLRHLTPPENSSSFLGRRRRWWGWRDVASGSQKQNSFASSHYHLFLLFLKPFHPKCPAPTLCRSGPSAEFIFSHLKIH